MTRCSTCGALMYGPGKLCHGRRVCCRHCSDNNGHGAACVALRHCSSCNRQFIGRGKVNSGGQLFCCGHCSGGRGHSQKCQSRLSAIANGEATFHAREKVSHRSRAMKRDAAILPPAGGAPKASQKVRMRGTVMQEQRVPMCEGYREAQRQAARDDLVRWLESSSPGASPAQWSSERPSAHSAPHSAPNGTDDGGGPEVVLTRNQHRLLRDELLKHKFVVESFEKVEAVYVSGGHCKRP